MIIFRLLNYYKSVYTLIMSLSFIMMTLFDIFYARIIEYISFALSVREISEYND